MWRKPQEAPKKAETFLDLVELHERAWGREGYPNKPSLADIMSSPIVVFWKPREPDDKKYRGLHTITLHESIRDVEIYLLKLLTRALTDYPDRYMYRIYDNKHRVILKTIRFIFTESE
jgi:hypothetical protein